MIIDAGVKEAYGKVRAGELQWAVFRYQGQKITVGQTGADSDYGAFLDAFRDNQVCFAYRRFEVKDASSERTEYVFFV